jgi:hypothetical protein
MLHGTFSEQSAPADVLAGMSRVSVVTVAQLHAIVRGGELVVAAELPDTRAASTTQALRCE